MSDALICDEIYAALENGPIRVPTHGSFRHSAKIYGSAKQVKQAMGSMIKDKIILRHRPEPEGCSGQQQTITFQLSSTASELYRERILKLA